jgi:hypothetical protein
MTGDAGLVDEPMVEDEPAKAARAPAKPRAPRAPRRTADGYVLPPLNLLAAYKPNDRAAPSQQVLQRTRARLKACSTISAYAARSSMHDPDRS